ncbi:MAG TPA: MBL fold metallo-hydrolase [Dehalococcoidia bacterium]|nr:MBL fold metallo-hydrolase [Dehalococcoidia bacterium]
MAKVETILQGFSLGTDQGNLAFCGVTLIEGTKRILVDVAHNGRRTLLLERLKQRGLTPDDIDYIFLTHSHWDHMLNIDLFPDAKVLIHPVEREYIKDPLPTDWATTGYTSLILESTQLQEVSGGEEVDDGVSVIETPGHSKGSMALLVRSDTGTLAVSGDALPNALSVKTGLPRIVFWDENEAKASIRKLLDAANTFYPGHERPFRVGDAGAITYLEPTGLRVFGLPEPAQGEGGLSMTYAMDRDEATEAEQRT